MDLLVKTGAVKLTSHLEKFLVADENDESVRQSRNGSSRRAVWIVELCSTNRDAVRFKNLNSGLYLTASDSPFLLGMTGRRVVQLSIFDPSRVEWEPICDGFQLKFRSSKEGKYLRANGGTPPWRNSVTHDSPLTGGTNDWILWDVEPVSLSDLGSFNDALSPLSSFNSVFSDDFGGSCPGTPMSTRSIMSPAAELFTKKRSGMDLFYNAKTVRLKSHHDKYLIAEEDEKSVSQERNGSARKSRWIVEPVEGSNHTIRLKSCYGKYLTASNQPFLLGMTGRKVVQSMPRRLDSSVEWEPTKDGSQVRLKTRYGYYLRANGGLPPWRNSVTHDVPHRTATQDWVVWDVDILEISDFPDNNSDGFKKMEDLKPKPKPGSDLGQVKVEHFDSFGSDMSSVSNGSGKYKRKESSDSGTYSPPKQDGRLIYYHVADDYGGVDDGVEGCSFTFKGHIICSDFSHTTDACPTLQTEDVNALGGYSNQSQRKYDPFSQTYNEGWRDHPNLRYGPRPPFPQSNQAKPFVQQNSQQSSSSLEDLVKQLTTQIGQVHNQGFQYQKNTDTHLQHIDTQIGQICTSLRNLESQISG